MNTRIKDSLLLRIEYVKIEEMYLQAQSATYREQRLTRLLDDLQEEIKRLEREEGRSNNE